MAAMEKLIIKLKLRQTGTAGAARNEAAVPVPYDCPLCGKSFKNGKALGGHKRVHLPKPQRTKDISSSNGENQEQSCPVCDQKFQSEKALHGHMRKHPDRNWRGMVPPTTKDNKQNIVNQNGGDPVQSPPLETNHDSSDQNQTNHDLMLSAWPRDGRRSRYGKAPMNGSNNNNNGVILSPDRQEEEVNMSEVYDLMALANGELAAKQDHAVTKKKKMELVVVENPGLGSSITGPEKHVYITCERPFDEISHHDSDVNMVDINVIRPAAEDDEFAGPVNEIPRLGGGQETRNVSPIFKFDLNELPPADEA